VILDIGCYDGTDGLEIQELLDGELHAFDPYSYDLFKGHGKPNVSFYPCAIGNEDSYVYFYPSPHAQSGSMRPPKEHIDIWPDITFDDRIKVRCFKLDTFWPKSKEIDFIWCDVNGAEVDFIRGAQETLKRTKFMYIEYSNKELYYGQQTMHEILALLDTWTVEIKYPGEHFGNLLLRNEGYGRDRLQDLAAGPHTGEVTTP
jgi:FkbM family methyltransferase